MSTILIVEDMAICRELMAAALRLHRYEVMSATSGRDALLRLAQKRPDLVLVDMSVPDLVGLDLLRTIRRHPAWQSLPIILLADSASRQHIALAAQYKVQGYLLKSDFSLERLLERIRSCLEPYGAQAKGEPTLRLPPHTAERSIPKQVRTPVPTAASIDDLRPLITREEFDALIDKGLNLRPLGMSIRNVMAVTAVAECSAEDVAKAVLQDQILSLRVLRIANSSAYSRGRPVENLKDAIQRIGIAEIRRLVMSLGVVRMHEQTCAASIDPRLFWEHSTACGLIAVAIAKHRGVMASEEYFMWGMLHDVGRLILVEHLPDAYAQVCAAAEELELPLEIVEPRLILQDHCHVLNRALEHWQFPREFVGPPVNHHRSLATMKRLGPQCSEAAATIAVADRLAHSLLLGSSGNDVIYPIAELMEFLSLSPESLKRIAQNVLDEARDLKLTTLARTDEGQWPDLATEQRERIASPLRPILLSPGSTADTVKLLLSRLETGDGPPNLAVAQVGSQEDVSQSLAKLHAEERKAGLADVPIMLIIAERNAHLDRGEIGRKCCWLKLPMRTSTFIRGARELLSESAGIDSLGAQTSSERSGSTQSILT